MANSPRGQKTLKRVLDAYLDRAANAPGSGLRAEDIDACDWIVVGHSHFDHLYGAERIAANTGARIIGSYETVRVMEQALRDGIIDRNPARVTGWQREYKLTEDELEDPRALALPDWNALSMLAHALVG